MISGFHAKKESITIYAIKTQRKEGDISSQIFLIFLISCLQFNKRIHNCAGWSVLGVVREEDDLTMDYVREEEGDWGYQFRPSDR